MIKHKITWLSMCLMFSIAGLWDWIRAGNGQSHHEDDSQEKDVVHGTHLKVVEVSAEKNYQINRFITSVVL